MIKTLIDSATITLQALQKALNTSDVAEISTTVFLHSKWSKKNGPKYQKVKTTEDLETEFLKLLTVKLKDVLTNTLSQSSAIYEYNHEDIGHNHLGVLKVNDDSLIKGWVDDFPEDVYDTIFRNEERFLEKLNYYAVSIVLPDGAKLIAVKQHTRNSLVNKKADILALFDKTSYKKLETPPLQFSTNINIFIWKGYVFILPFCQQQFEQIFDYENHYRHNAVGHLNEIAKIIPINCVKELEPIISGNTLLARKIHGIVKSKAHERATLTELRTKVAEQKLSIKIEESNGKFRLIIDHNSADQIKHLLSLLGEEYYLGFKQEKLQALQKKKRA